MGSRRLIIFKVWRIRMLFSYLNTLLKTYTMEDIYSHVYITKAHWVIVSACIFLRMHKMAIDAHVCLRRAHILTKTYTKNLFFPVEDYICLVELINSAFLPSFFPENIWENLFFFMNSCSPVVRILLFL
eukprot:TRINITY_DN347_c8_g1_i2.p1 TRINITY_DN347_c8_g1~~TRINITY_DN347_c8_g1_i2.p1  ORF type:complete len:129 (+),score=6.24 TRINITY_DN347_c8_g1_i2:254-640(+)